MRMKAFNGLTIGLRVTASVVLAGLAGASIDAAWAEEPAAPIRPSTYDWQGPYVGLLVGLSSFRTAHNDLSGNPAGIDGDGRIAGVIGGYNFTHDNWVYGPEADLSYGMLKATENGSGIKSDIQAGLRARLGYRYKRSLPFVTAGLMLAQVDYHSQNPLQHSNTTQWSITAGGGIDMAFTPALSGRVEYLYGHAIKNDQPGIDEVHMIRAAAIYHFSQ